MNDAYTHDLALEQTTKQALLTSTFEKSEMTAPSRVLPRPSVHKAKEPALRRNICSHKPWSGMGSAVRLRDVLACLALEIKKYRTGSGEPREEDFNWGRWGWNFLGVTGMVPRWYPVIVTFTTTALSSHHPPISAPTHRLQKLFSSLVLVAYLQSIPPHTLVIIQSNHMASEAPYLRAILPSLPTDVAKKIRILCGAPDSSAEYVLDTLIRFVSGAECAPAAPQEARALWPEKQREATKILNGMIHRPGEAKRAREDDDDADADATSQASKRQKSSALEDTTTTPLDEEIFTLHAVSTTSPIRKKVDITICKASLKFTHSTTHTLEATVPRSGLTRAFLLPTRGKTKPHWTVVILSTDTTERSKPNAPVSSTPSQQVIFGLDATTPSALTSTTHPTSSTSPAQVNTISKGNPSLPALRAFFTALSLPLLEPSPSVFKSVCTGPGTGASALPDGVPGVEAYRSAKQGSLWFMPAGILWGESKPCEFWAVENLVGKADGVRVVNASGRTCSVVLTRKSGEEENGEGEGDGGEDMGVETEFSLVDSREKAGIDVWVRAYRHLFGKVPQPGAGLAGAGGAAQMEDSDEDDEDFEMDSDEVGDTSSSSSEESDDGDEEDGSAGDPDGSDAEGSDEEEELKEENHPLMKPGAMPRMSRAAIDMVVGMVEDDMMGVGSGDELEEDELDD
ncbi:histone chaperone Rttp106-like-domain-containing protein [Collybia nuda]|uniref:Histone chaperone Rttp106-like-domain-containing protein n=1 Tax=Collybia nuda TaxID=64659 RepID=A0A9P6CAR6_9AGAR|nr:histone chaperone Rttp106-like-domain-containing protein [Collybia nuda]